MLKIASIRYLLTGDGSCSSSKGAHSAAENNQSLDDMRLLM